MYVDVKEKNFTIPWPFKATYIPSKDDLKYILKLS